MKPGLILLVILGMLLLGGGIALMGGDNPGAVVLPGEEMVEPDPDEDLSVTDSADLASATGDEDAGADREELEDGARSRTGPGRSHSLGLEGRVVNASGGPIANAAVTLFLRRDRSPGEGFGGRGEGFSSRSSGRNMEDIRRAMEDFQVRKSGESIITGADGRFLLRGLAYEHSALELAIQHDAFAPALVRKDWAKNDGSLRMGDITLTGGGKVSGIVRDENKQPIAGAKIRYEESRGRGPSSWFGGGDQSPIENMVEEIESDGSGLFTMEHLPEGSFTLAAESQGHLPSSTSRLEVKPEQEVEDQVIVLESGLALRGIVRDHDGKPIANAEVECEQSRQALTELFRQEREQSGNNGSRENDRGRDERGGRESGRGGGRDWGDLFRRMGRFEEKTKTNSRGEFTFEVVPRSGVRLTARHDKYIEEEVDPVDAQKTPSVEIRMYHRIAVRGTVVDASSGTPIDLYGIRARKLRDRGNRGGFGGFGGSSGGRGESDRGGRSDRGDRTSRSSGDRGDRTNREGGDRSGGTSRSGGDRSGGDRGDRTNREGGEQRTEAEELERAQRTAERDAERRTREAEREAREAREEAYKLDRLGASGEIPGPTPPPTKHEAGTFLIDGLQPGRYVFDIAAPGYVKTAEGIIELQPGQKEQTVTFRIVGGNRIEGIVINQADSKPIPKARIELFVPPLDQPAQDQNGRSPMSSFFSRGRNEGWRMGEATAGSDGRFSFEAQKAGNYRLRVRAKDRLTLTQDVMLTVGRDAANLRLVVSRGAQVSGNVRGLGEGERARVVITHTDGTEKQGNADQETGAYKVTALKAGGWFVRVDLRDREREDWFRRFGVSILQRTQRQPDLILTEGAKIRFDPDINDGLGVVKGLIVLNGKPGKGLEARLQAKKDNATNTPTTNESGSREGRFMASMASRLFQDRTNDSGEFEISSVVAGAYTLEIRRSSQRGRGGSSRGGSSAVLHREDIVMREGSIVERRVTLLTGRLRLQIQDAASSAAIETRAVRVEVALASEAGSLTAEKWDDLPSYRRIGARNGAVDAADVKIGDWVYSISASGFEQATGRMTVLGGDDPLPTKVNLKKKAEPKEGEGPKGDAGKEGGENRGGEGRGQGGNERGGRGGR